MELTEIADELYAQPPNAFTAARDEAVARARAAGDRATATQLAALKRPTVGAWLVNVVALRQPADLRRLFDAADAIRAAQGAAELRELSQRRRREIDSVLAAARALAAQAGAAPPTRQQLAEAESTLTAAMADADAARIVAAGRVLKALSYGGLGVLGSVTTVANARASAPAAKERTESSDSAGDEAVAAARAAAQARVAEATHALAGATEAELQATRRTAELNSEIQAMRERLDDAERRARAARQARLAAERDLAAARRRLDRTG